MIIEKRKPYKNKAIRDSAQGEECTFNSPICNYNRDTTVFCHLNEEFAGKGLSQKADDCAGFYGCSACHDLYDRRTQPPSQIYVAQEYFYVLRAMTRTIRRLLDKGILK